MRKIALPSTAIAILGAMLALLHAAPAQAQATRTWVSGTGSDGNPCTRTMPCLTFSKAITVTAAGGEINCLDPGGFGQVTITQSVTIACDNTQAGILALLDNDGIVVTVGPSDIVTLKGLDIEGSGTGRLGINFFGSGTLHVHNVRIRNFRNPGGSGIGFYPTGYSELYVADSHITGNGGGVQYAGIYIQPQAAASANISIDRVRLENNSNGLLVAGHAGTGIANVVVRDSAVTGSAGHGIAAFTQSDAAAILVSVHGTKIAFNFDTGIHAAGYIASGTATATVRIDASTIVHNVTGVARVGSAVLQSFKNNQIAKNLANGTPIAAVPGAGGPLQ